jgi:hypothetical protein
MSAEGFHKFLLFFCEDHPKVSSCFFEILKIVPKAGQKNQ